MNYSKLFTLALATAAAISVPALAQEKAGAAQVTASVNQLTDMTEGEVRKIDKEARKITIKHGEIKNLDMPGMTMVFQVKDPALLEKVKAGDKVKFRVEKMNGALVATEIQPSK